MVNPYSPFSLNLPGAGSHRQAGASAYAALDLGTNNCRLLIGTPAGGSFRVLDSFSRIVRLGEGLQTTGRLSPRAMERTLSALRVCVARMQRRTLSGVRAVATEACRHAVNGRDFLSRVQAETGLDFDVISTREEIELALESCIPLLRRTEARRILLFDIGGGSTELAWVRIDGNCPVLVGTVSLPVGVVRLAEQYGDARFSAGAFEEMVQDVRQRLETFEDIHRIHPEILHGGVALLGTSGTATTIASICFDLNRYRRCMVDGAVMSLTQADQAVQILRALGGAEPQGEGLRKHPCIGPQRADFVLPGCAIFQAIRSLWPTTSVIVADRGLREGMLLRMMHEAGHGGRRGRRKRNPAIPSSRSGLTGSGLEGPPSGISTRTKPV
ncbi:Ppx/GppA phosphatase family protein [Granulibacter bethesdensis]|uniref:Exopolyphosphatase n=1 Tax=Granulibacter bethesdensis (strain ATCC BAA-1260 / CGDNIH1) TaxID=391165 RepID=Q0BT09_GRABC|nr:Ppx/GppA phosphatase family protein [Granulibacter bethesdensis]ABI62043.1 Exopolyphosphatase [Granulibacter bethesdensis CGDNIH1]AHJ69062.1 Exopolyphosphatase [Granulibacter bethesdensis]APH51863.1 Exopolyphosphatase [Granulibacter bethesdensis]APH64554.1 Exopolyphosphatase [Granulibacter bethesdensis]